MNSPTIPKQKYPNQFWVIVLLILVLSFVPVGIPLSNGSCKTQQIPEQTRIYHLNVSTYHDNISSTYHGYLELKLAAINSELYQGNLTWFLTWDNGLSWTTSSLALSYSGNRSYQFVGLLLYTAWWVPHGLQLGDEVRIDGDPPSTNHLLRTTPFIVTDLVSIQVHSNYYLCWQLSYESTSAHHETFHYEFHTGILINAQSILIEEGQPIHEVYVELTSSYPSLPTLHPLLHYWTSYYSMILALVGATIVTLVANFILRHLSHSPQKLQVVTMEQNA